MRQYRTLPTLMVIDDVTKEEDDFVAIETALEVRLNKEFLAAFVCSPGLEKELSIGYLLSTGIVGSFVDISEIKYSGNRCSIKVKEDVIPQLNRGFSQIRRFIGTECSAPEVLRELRTAEGIPSITKKAEVNLKKLYKTAGLLREAQTGRKRTGALHGALVYSLTEDRYVMAEDLGRHNAVDKTIGLAVQANIDLTECIMISSGRLTADIVIDGIIGAMHEIGPATSRAIQIRLWFGLIQDFVDLSDGQIKWEVLLDFIETTALQSHKGRSAPLTIDEGRRALTELLADEALIALRANKESKFIEMEQGLWIVNSSVLKKLKETATKIIEAELKKHHSKVSRNHGYYDLCANNTSYVIFPNQQQLSTLLNLHSDVACRTCKSSKVVCILTASEYLEDSVVTPGNLIIKTMDDSISAFVT